MPPTLETIDPLAKPGWDDLVAAHPSGSFFHTSSWAKVLSESYGYRPAYFAFLEKGSLDALLPVMEIDSMITGKRGVALPFSDYADPFARDDEQYKALWDLAVQHGVRAGWKTLEIRGGASPWAGAANPSGFFGHRLSLTGEENGIHAGFRTNTKRNIARAKKEGVEIEMSGSTDALEAYYRLHCITRKGHGIPPQPLKFFRKIQEHVLRPGMGIIALAKSNGTYVAGIVLFHHGKKVLYKYGASNDAGRRCRANHLVMWEAIRWYRQKGFTEFCFGRTETGNDGLREYKSGYGSSEYEIPYYRYDIAGKHVVSKNPAIVSGRLERCYRKVPIPVSRVIGSLVYRHIG